MGREWKRVHSEGGTAGRGREGQRDRRGGGERGSKWRGRRLYIMTIDSYG